MSRPPVGKNWQDFWDKWIIWNDNFRFGNDRGGYFHSGFDLNLKTGANTDVGETYQTVLPGRLVYYHNASHPSRNFGRHNVYMVDTPRGKRWIHGAHLQELTTGVQDVSEGQKIGEVGKSGTDFGHLHFSVFKVDPSTLPNGIDTIAKTKQQLSDWWEDPEVFLKYIENLLDTQENLLEKKYTEQEMTEVRLERDQNWNLYQEQLAETEKYKAEASSRKAENEETLSQFAQKLGLPSTSDKSDILGAVDRLLTVEDQLTAAKKEIMQEEKKHELEKIDMKAEMSKLRDEVNEQQKQNERLLGRIDDLEKRLDAQEKAKDQVSRFQAFLESLLSKFN